jgi:hypothetical protein
MKKSLRILTLSCFTLSTTAGMSGCTDAGGVLAKESAKFAICALDQGSSCQISAPAGTKVEKATVATADDAIRVSGTVSSVNECEGFAAHAKSRSPKHIAQATINNTVVMPYGEVLTHTPSIKSACATPPYNVSLTVAKAP